MLRARKVLRCGKFIGLVKTKTQKKLQGKRETIPTKSILMSIKNAWTSDIMVKSTKEWQARQQRHHSEQLSRGKLIENLAKR